MSTIKRVIEYFNAIFIPKCKCSSKIVSPVFKIKKSNKRSKSKQRGKK